MYFVVAFILIFFAVFELIDRSKIYKNIALFICGFVLVFFAATRYDVGTDWDAYYINYKIFYWDVEWGYKYLNLIFSKYFEAPYYVFLFFLNALSLYLICKYIKELSGYYIIALLVFYSDLFMYYNLSGIRQAIATSFTCFALIFAVKRNLWLFALFMICAAMFHVTSLIFVFAYFLPRKILNLKTIFIIGIFSYLVVFLINTFVGSIDYLSKKNEYYTEVSEVAGNIQLLFMVGLAKRAIIIIVFLCFIKQLIKYDHLMYFFNVYLIGFIIYASLYLMSADFGVRLSSYYTILDTILVGNIIYYVRSRTMKILVFILFCGLALYKVNVYANEKTYEYKTIIE